MNRNEFKTLQVGDMVIITIHGQNQGKIGIVKEIHSDGGFGGGCAYLEPTDSEFKFANKHRTNKDGLYAFRHEFIRKINNTKEDIEEVRKLDDILTGEEARVILKVARRFGCDGDGDILKLFVKDDSGIVVVMGRL